MKSWRTSRAAAIADVPADETDPWIAAGTGLGAFEWGGNRTAEEIDHREHVAPRSFPEPKARSIGHNLCCGGGIGRDGRNSPQAPSIEAKDATVNSASAID